MSASYGSVPGPPSFTAVSWRQTNIPVLVVAFTAALATGAPTYAFGLYGATLKTTLHLSQSQLNLISSATFCAGLLSWIPGMCVDKWGCKYSMVVGGTIQSLGLSAYWLAATKFALYGTLSSITVPVLSLLGVVIFMSNSLVIGSVFKVVVVSCGSGTRGSAVGVAKGYLGLGAGAYSCLFDALRTPTMSDLGFLPMASALALVCIVAPAFLLLPNKKEQVMDVVTPRHFRLCYMGLLVLALLVVGTSAAFLFEPMPKDYTEIPKSDDPSVSRATGILLAWLSPIVGLFFVPRSPPSLEEMESFLSTIDDDADESNEYSLCEMLHTVTAWLLCWTCTILVGSGTVLTNNMGQEVKALHFPARAATGCIAMFSVAQSMSRVLCGAISEWASTLDTNLCGIHQGVPRPFFLVVASAFGVAAHSILAVGETRSWFVMGVVVSGIAFGMVWPLMVLIVGEVFGTMNHGANYMFYDGFTSAIGTLLISNFLASSVYESHIKDEDEIACFGKGCFQLTHVIIAALCGSCLVTSVGLLVKTSDVYGRPTSEQTHHRRNTDELFGSPYRIKKKRTDPTET